MLMQKFVPTERSLAVAQLEIALTAFSVCAVVIYILNWWKLKDVRTRTYSMTVPGTATGDVVRAPQEQWSISKALGVILIK
jgi:hypothetical protein